MASFRVSIYKNFGEISIDGADEKEILENIKRLQNLGEKIENIIGYDILIPEDTKNKLSSLDYAERILVLLSYSPKELSREECMRKTHELQIPEGWWKGSNFSRDMKKQESQGRITIKKNKKLEYALTTAGRKHVKSLLK